MDYRAAEAFLFALPQFTAQGAAAYRPGFARIEALLAGMGDPQTQYPTVHIAGTNGKGSTASLVAAIASAAGYSVGLHTSPHLYHLGERLRINGVPADEAWLAAAVTRYQPLFDTIQPSFFEATVALSLSYFAEQAVDLAVVEVGLGGRLDATNILAPVCTAITRIGFDHAELLGSTLGAIAGEKAGIIKPGVPVVVAAQVPEALAVLRRVAAEQGAPFHHVGEEVTLREVTVGRFGLSLQAKTAWRDYGTLAVGLTGAHQQQNAALALRIAEVLPLPLSAEAVRVGLAEVRERSGLRGRLEVFCAKPLVVADVAHNPEGVAVALAFMRQTSPTGRLFVLLGAMADKDWQGMLQHLSEAKVRLFAVSMPAARSAPAEQLSAYWKTLQSEAAPYGTVAAGLAWFAAEAAPADALLLVGSHGVVAQVTAAQVAETTGA